MTPQSWPPFALAVLLGSLCSGCGAVMAVPVVATYALVIMWGAAFSLFVIGWAVAALYGGHWKQLIIVVGVGLVCGLATMGIFSLLSGETENMVAGFVVGFGGPAATTAAIMILVNFVKWVRARLSRKRQGAQQDAGTAEGRKASIRLGLPVVIGSVLVWYVFVPVITITTLVFVISASYDEMYDFESGISLYLVLYLAVECQLALVRYIFAMGVLYARSFARRGTVVLGWITAPFALLGVAVSIYTLTESEPSYYLFTIGTLLYLLLAVQAILIIRIGRRPALKRYCGGHRVDEDASGGSPESRETERSRIRGT